MREYDELLGYSRAEATLIALLDWDARYNYGGVLKTWEAEQDKEI